jgi:hypothetical protein
MLKIFAFKSLNCDQHLPFLLRAFSKILGLISQVPGFNADAGKVNFFVDKRCFKKINDFGAARKI